MTKKQAEAQNLNAVANKDFTLYIFECVIYNKLKNIYNILNNIGDDNIGGTPVPMPNTAVKPYDAEDT